MRRQRIYRIYTEEKNKSVNVNITARPFDSVLTSGWRAAVAIARRQSTEGPKSAVTSYLSREKRDLVHKAEAGSPTRGLRTLKMQGEFRELACTGAVCCAAHTGPGTTMPLPVIIVDGGPSAGKCHMYSQAARCTPPLA
jgi:hypothetical protein